MARKTLIALLVVATAAAIVGFSVASRATAADIRVTSGDANSRFMALGVSKSVVIDFPTDVKDVLVADKGIVTAVMRTNRRVYIIGAALGQTNVYFYGPDGRQIGAFDIAVQATSQPANLEDYAFPANVVVVYRDVHGQTLSCTPTMCIDANKPGSDQVPGTQNINVTGSTTTVAVSPK